MWDWANGHPKQSIKKSTYSPVYRHTISNLSITIDFKLFIFTHYHNFDVLPPTLGFFASFFIAFVFLGVFLSIFFPTFLSTFLPTFSPTFLSIFFPIFFPTFFPTFFYFCFSVRVSKSLSAILARFNRSDTLFADFSGNNCFFSTYLDPFETFFFLVFSSCLTSFFIFYFTAGVLLLDFLFSTLLLLFCS